LDYEPQIVKAGLSDIELVGMHYHHVYDVFMLLFTIRRNMARAKGCLVNQCDWIKLTPEWEE
jgi:hypothetical protein